MPCALAIYPRTTVLAAVARTRRFTGVSSVDLSDSDFLRLCEDLFLGEYDDSNDGCDERSIELRNHDWAVAHTSREEEDAERAGMEAWDHEMAKLALQADQSPPATK